MKSTKRFKLLINLFVILIVLISYAAIKEYYTIEVDKCTFCGECFEVCPDEAISATKIDGKDVYIIDPVKCTACGECVDVCPEECILEAKSDIEGYVKEEVKETPKKKKKKKKNK